jgi:hypothetical protein
VCVFEWMEPTFLELQLYSMRRISVFFLGGMVSRLLSGLRRRRITSDNRCQSSSFSSSSRLSRSE